MSYVYIIRSIDYPEIVYVGFTKRIENRIKAHNFGQAKYSSKYKPWKVVATIQFNDDSKAKKFEKYLKTASGKAFLTRHFL